MHTPSSPVVSGGDGMDSLSHPSPSEPSPHFPSTKPKEWLTGLLANDILTQRVGDRDIPGWPHFLGPVMVSVLTKDNVSQSFHLLRRALLYRDAETLGSRASLGPGVGGWGQGPARGFDVQMLQNKEVGAGIGQGCSWGSHQPPSKQQVFPLVGLSLSQT